MSASEDFTLRARLVVVVFVFSAPGAGCMGGTRTVWPVLTRVLALARAPSTRISPVRHAFSIWPCVRPWNLRFSQRSRRVSSSSASTSRFTTCPDVPAHAITRLCDRNTEGDGGEARDARSRANRRRRRPCRCARSVAAFQASRRRTSCKPPNTPTPRRRRQGSPALALCASQPASTPIRRLPVTLMREGRPRPCALRAQAWPAKRHSAPIAPMRAAKCRQGGNSTLRRSA